MGKKRLKFCLNLQTFAKEIFHSHLLFVQTEFYRGDLRPKQLDRSCVFPHKAGHQPFPNIRCLHLDFGVEQAVLDHLLQLMPNVTSLVLKGPTLIGRANPFPHLMGTRARITEVDLGDISVSDDQLIDLVKKFSQSLEKLCFRDSSSLTSAGFSSIATCTRLRSLSIRRGFGGSSLEDTHMQKIVDSAPHLETLLLQHHELLTEAAFVNVHNLRLRNWRLRSPQISSEAIARLRMIETLQNLDLRGCNFKSENLHILANLNDLRALMLDCDMDPEGFDVIFNSFKRLEALLLGNCERLSDTEGVKFREFKNLQTLSFKRALRFTDRTFEGGLGSRFMWMLDVRGCPLTNKGLAGIASHHKRLEGLTFEDFSNTYIYIYI